MPSSRRLRETSANISVNKQNKNKTMRNILTIAISLNRFDWFDRERRTNKQGGNLNEYDFGDCQRNLNQCCRRQVFRWLRTDQRWHTCPNTAPINSSNPCSEYMFIDDSACNLSSINLMKFRREDGSFDAESVPAAVRIFITAQEILVDHASYPTDRIAPTATGSGRWGWAMPTWAAC